MAPFSRIHPPPCSPEFTARLAVFSPLCQTLFLPAPLFESLTLQQLARTRSIASESLANTFFYAHRARWRRCLCKLKRLHGPREISFTTRITADSKAEDKSTYDSFSRAIQTKPPIEQGKTHDTPADKTTATSEIPNDPVPVNLVIL